VSYRALAVSRDPAKRVGGSLGLTEIIVTRGGCMVRCGNNRNPQRGRRKSNGFPLVGDRMLGHSKSDDRAIASERVRVVTLGGDGCHHE